MIHREHGKITFECDGCDELLEPDARDWPRAHAAFNEARWKAEKVGEEWTHLCPRCKSTGSKTERVPS